MSLSVTELLEGSGAPPKTGVGVVLGLNSDSRAIERGDVFFALPGQIYHGNDFIAEAVKRGALAIVTDKDPADDPGVPVIVVDDVRAAYARAASRIFAPQPETTVAVTGTNGKTSIASFVRQIWTHAGIPAASVGTLGVDTASKHIEGSLTTPDSRTLHQNLHALKQEGIDYVALEASSHGLDQRRLDGIRFRAVAFTNLSRDHLDYHADMEDYFAAKMRLFSEVVSDGGAAVIWADDAWSDRAIAAARARGLRLLTVGEKGEALRLLSRKPGHLGQDLEIDYQGVRHTVMLRLIGAYQAANALVAAGLALATGMEPARVFDALGRLQPVRGRLERAAISMSGAPIYVDYAHTPDALAAAIEALRPHVSGRLITVFGAGGDRDQGKRPEMGRAAVQHSDLVIVTDDNPRGEDPAAIRAQVLAGAAGAREIGGRREAIRAAIAEARAGDIVLIAGKGHEQGQIVGSGETMRVLPFDDVSVARECAAELGGAGR